MHVESELSLDVSSMTGEPVRQFQDGLNTNKDVLRASSYFPYRDTLITGSGNSYAYGSRWTPKFRLDVCCGEHTIHVNFVRNQLQIEPLLKCLGAFRNIGLKILNRKQARILTQVDSELYVSGSSMSGASTSISRWTRLR